MPSCFQPASFYTAAPLRALIELRFAKDRDAADRLRDVHDLALAVADLAMDFLRSGGADSAAFRNSDYDYMHNVVRDGPRVFREQAKRSAPAPVEAGLSDAPVSVRPMTRNFAERMALGTLSGPARRILLDPRGTGEVVDWTACPPVAAQSAGR